MTIKGCFLAILLNTYNSIISILKSIAKRCVFLFILFLFSYLYALKYFCSPNAPLKSIPIIYLFFIFLLLIIKRLLVLSLQVKKKEVNYKKKKEC